MLRGDTTIAYPGNLHGRHIERQARGALLVEVDGTRSLRLTVWKWCAALACAERGIDSASTPKP